MATERIQIIVTSKGTVTVRKEIAAVGATATKAASGVDILKTALLGFGASVAIRSILAAADSFTVMSNKIRILTGDNANLGVVMEKLYNIAQTSRSGWDETVQLYQKLSQSTKARALGEEGMLKLTESISKATIVSGASAQQASAGILQLGQAFTSGMLAGDEFKSISENMPYLLDLIAKGADLPREKLKQLGTDGKLSAETLIKAFKKMGPEIDAAFKTTVPTISGALIVLNNAWVRLVGAISTGTGVFSYAAYAIIFLADNLGFVAIAIAPVIAALSVLAVQWIGGALITAIVAANAALGSMILGLGKLALFIYSNPITIFVAAIVGLLFYLGVWEGKIYDIIIAYGKLKTIIADALGNADAARDGIKIVVDAEKAKADLKEAAREMLDKIKEGGDPIPPKLEAALRSGGNAAAGAIKGAAASGAAAVTKSAQSTYEALNGVPQKIKGAVEETGGYIKNQVTGAVTKSGSVMSGNIKTGGETAGKTIENHMAAGGQKAGAALYQNVEQAFANLGNRFLIMQLAVNKLTQEINKVQSETGLNNANAAKARAEANNLNRRFTGGGSSSSGSGGSSGGSGGGGNAFGFLSSRDVAAQQAAAAAGGGTTLGAGANATRNIQITNVVDPNMVTQVNETSSGQQSIINVVAANREEIQRILGVA